ncbi:MAG TPA: hypothetical protein VLA88_00585 [Candidatus Saccharimonadales bacterium]|nr:hypothetical protein [Candidatus Saccharimonadales bacterium]
MAIKEIVRVSLLKHTHYFAEYNCGAYGAGDYQGACGTTSTDLADTGYDVLLPIFLAISLIGAGAIYFIKRQLRKRAARRDAKNV